MSSIPTYLPSPILGDTSIVLHTANTLLHLTKLHQILPSNQNNQRIIQGLQTIWKKVFEAIDNDQSPEEVRTFVDKEFDDWIGTVSPLLKRKIISLKTLYSKELLASQTLEDLNSKVRSFFSDTISLMANPLAKSERGEKGPTLLATYTRYDEELIYSQLHSYVLKYSDWSELYSTRLYDLFSTSLNAQEIFSTPPMGALDFKRNIHALEDTSESPLSPEMGQRLRETFDKILQVAAPGIIPQGDALLLMERISGSNLFDFARTKYPELNPSEKLELFSRLAELANDIDAELLKNNEHIEKYLAFLKDHFQKSNAIEILAAKMQQSLLNALNQEVSEGKPGKTLAQLQSELNPFTLDLQELAYPALCSGLNKMLEKIESAPLPMLSNEEEMPLKGQIASVFPHLLDSINQRFEIFKLVRN